MTDADMTRPAADDHPKDPDHAPAVEPTPPGDAEELGEDEQGDQNAAEIEQTGGKVANPYME
jgi:hypothetical protein